MRAKLAFVVGATASLLAAPVLAIPLITNVVDVHPFTGGDSSLTKSLWTGTSFSVVAANEPVPGLAVGNTYTVGTFGELAPAYTDRGHRYTGASGTVPLPSYLVGREYVMTENNNRGSATYRMDVTVSAAVTAYLLVDNRVGDGTTSGNSVDPPHLAGSIMQWVLDDGWTATSNGLNRAGDATRPDEVGIDEASFGGLIDSWFSVYMKVFSVGTFSLDAAENGSRNMYGLVVVGQSQVSEAPVPGTLALGLLGLAGIATARRRA